MRTQPVAIIIPTYAHFAYAQLTIESAARTPNVTLLIMDDGSPDWPGERIIRGWIPATVPFIIERYDHNARSLTRSWNAGLRLAQQLDIPFTVCGNADLIFARGWWEPIEEALRAFDFVGPLTNAPGHSKNQSIANHLPGYELSDDPDDIDRARQLLSEASIPTTRLNGFCIAGRTTSFLDCGGFSPDHPMQGNEDEFFARTQNANRKLGICLRSFVFHFRSVARGLHSSPHPQGAMRLRGCTGCERSIPV